jgi:ABC-2 type transport system ATP-binding protein
MKLVQCTGLRHSYDGVRDAIHDLTFCVRGGEVLGLIGPNGAGKSTTLRILATLQRPDAGLLEWDGVDVRGREHEVRTRIGFLGDGTALYPTMTAAGYLRFFAECYQLSAPRVEERVGYLLETFDLRAKADAVVGDLSKGMRQRLAIARAMIQEPELLLLDEPADGLDPSARRQLRDILRAIADGGVGIVVSSHILRELDGFVDAVALIQHGRLELHGPVDEVIARWEVGRRLHEIEIVAGMDRALAVLGSRPGLLEAAPARLPSSSGAGAAGAGKLRVRIHGDAQEAAALLTELVSAGVAVASFAKVRSDLEDVYQAMGRDRVS